jgi:hypothetical protein
MAIEVETRAGRCATHGTIEATREMPKSGFPLDYQRPPATDRWATTVSLPDL